MEIPAFPEAGVALDEEKPVAFRRSDSGQVDDVDPGSREPSIRVGHARGRTAGRDQVERRGLRRQPVGPA